MINGDIGQTDNFIIEKYCYDNNAANCDIYGGLYQWDEMMEYYATPGVQGICPSGWHLPTDEEWTILTDFLGGTGVAGGKMKETGITHWNSPNTGATNESGFTGLPGGKNTFGNFDNLGYHGFFWSSSACTPSFAYNWYLWYVSDSFIHDDEHKGVSYSARCVKDED